jgi:Carboxypeptidase regulatory-like domain
MAQQGPSPQTSGSIRGSVQDPSGAMVAGAVVTLEGAGSDQQQRTTITDSAGEFRFFAVAHGTYKLTITASGFAVWTAENVTPVIDENPMPILAALRVAPASTAVNVSLPPHELAAEQIKAEEKQRVLGVFPNFFVTYEPNAAPLTARQKFDLGWKTFFDPVPVVFSGVGAGIQQARKSYPEYGQDVEGFSKRFGANYADRVDDVLIGHVVMQSVFHQDPRYFYKGTGSFGSRALYAIATAFVAKGDNGHWQPAYSDVFGGMGSYGISTLYRLGTSRPGPRLEHTILLDFAGRAPHNLLEEFVLHKVSTHVPKSDADFDGRPEHKNFGEHRSNWLRVSQRSPGRRRDCSEGWNEGLGPSE